MLKTIVSIPVYKEKLSEFEKVSLIQCCKILYKYDFSIVCPEDLNINKYLEVLDQFKINYKIESFSNEFFKSVEKYNRLMLDINFYKKYQKYDFMLVYQLDAYVFKDDLEYWCKKDFDYIGAPWFEYFSVSNGESKMLSVAGNGGFSLRKISSFISVLNQEDEVNNFIKKYLEDGQNEDLFFSRFAKNINKDFKVAPSNEAMYFSFECQPERLYKMTNKKLPFGCHAWERYGFNFWEKYINLEDVDFKRENKINLEKLSKMRKDMDFKIGKIKCLFDELEVLKKEYNKIKDIDKKANKLGDNINEIYSSLEWRIALKIQRIFKMLFPGGSLRRKVLVKLFRFFKRTVKITLKTKRRILEIFLLSKNYLMRFKPRKKRKINLKSKKIVYVGHSYHNKTKSTVFLIDYLKEFFEVEVVLDESWKSESAPDLSFIDESYLGVIFFQSLPCAEELKKIKNDNLIFFPMYDGVPHNYDFWCKYYNLKVINFSSTLHKKLKKWRFESIYIQYFPDLQKFIPGKKDEVFFWQRLTKVAISTIIKLLDKESVRIHIHKAIDPGQEFIKPSEANENKFKITYSDWFDTREEMWDVIKSKGVYIAPREYEGIGMSFLEAMAMGKAVIAVNNPTMNEYIEHGRTGYLYDLENPKEIDLSNIEEVQKNTYKYMQEGYQQWEKDKKKIIEFIRQI